jgi:hypothetical protein
MSQDAFIGVFKAFKLSKNVKPKDAMGDSKNSVSSLRRPATEEKSDLSRKLMVEDLVGRGRGATNPRNS